MIWNRAAKVKKEIKTNASKYKVKCNKLQHDVNQLLTVNEIEDRKELRNSSRKQQCFAINNKSSKEKIET